MVLASAFPTGVPVGLVASLFHLVLRDELTRATFVIRADGKAGSLVLDYFAGNGRATLLRAAGSGLSGDAAVTERRTDPAAYRRG